MISADSPIMCHKMFCSKYVLILVLTISAGEMQSTSVAMVEAVDQSGWMTWYVRVILLWNSALMLDGVKATAYSHYKNVAIDST